MHENDIAKIVIDCAFKVHTTLGPGLLESVYEVVLCHELKQRGQKVARQVAVPIVYDTVRFDEGFRLDLLVDEKVVVEI